MAAASFLASGGFEAEFSCLSNKSIPLHWEVPHDMVLFPSTICVVARAFPFKPEQKRTSFAPT